MKLTHLTDRALVFETTSLVGRERTLLSQILWHLKEIDRRKLYADYKCGSLFEFCVKVLKYSEGQASRRVSAARLLNEMPEVAKNIQQGEINLTQLNQLKGFFQSSGMTDVEEKRKVIDEVKGKTVNDRAIASKLRPSS